MAWPLLEENFFAASLRYTDIDTKKYTEKDMDRQTDYRELENR